LFFIAWKTAKRTTTIKDYMQGEFPFVYIFSVICFLMSINFRPYLKLKLLMLNARLVLLKIN